jgi:hypothetical protein
MFRLLTLLAGLTAMIPAARAQTACDKPRNDFDGLYCLSKIYQQADQDLGVHQLGVPRRALVQSGLGRRRDIVAASDVLSPDTVMAGEGPLSTPFCWPGPQDVDGAPTGSARWAASRTMTIRSRRRVCHGCLLGWLSGGDWVGWSLCWLASDACRLGGILWPGLGRGAGLGGDPCFGSFQACGDALVALVSRIGLGPGQAVGFGCRRDLACLLDQVEGFLDFRLGLDGRRFGLDGLGLAAGLLELVQTTLGFGGFTVEADGTAAEAKDAGHGHV